MYRQRLNLQRGMRPAHLVGALAGSLLLALLLTSCGGDQVHGGMARSGAHMESAQDHGHHGASPDMDHSEHMHGESLGTPTDFSLYHLDAPWTDQQGQTRQLSSLGGRVQVVAMVYTNCGYACPRILMDMKRIEGEIPAELRDRVGFVMVTIDPERDTPAQLAAYADAVHLDPENWTLLTAPDNTILELAALLGVKYRRIDENDFSHSNVITVLDQRGEIAHRQLGLGAEPGRTLRVIEGLIRGAE